MNTRPYFTGLVHHTDAGSQYTSIAFTDRLIEEGVDPSVGSVDNVYDNASPSPRSVSTRPS